MLLILAKKYWMEILVVLAVTITYGYIKHLKNENDGLVSKVEQLKGEKAQYAYALNFQNEAIVSNKADYDRKSKQLPTVLKEIDIQYKTKHETIYQWRDDNETNDCNESMRYLDSFQF